MEISIDFCLHTQSIVKRNMNKLLGFRIGIPSCSVSFLYFLLMSVCLSLAASLFYLPLIAISNMLVIEKPDKQTLKHWLQTTQF